MSERRTAGEVLADMIRLTTISTQANVDVRVDVPWQNLTVDSNGNEWHVELDLRPEDATLGDLCDRLLEAGES